MTAGRGKGVHAENPGTGRGGNVGLSFTGRLVAGTLVILKTKASTWGTYRHIKWKRRKIKDKTISGGAGKNESLNNESKRKKKRGARII